MDLVTVRWFLRVAETGNVTRAAEELRISQPGLSRAIARLQHDLRAPLFDREGRTLRLNAYGAIFREHAERLVAAEGAARQALAQAADPEHGEVGLAFLHTQGTALVPELLRAYRAAHPRVDFRLTQGSAERIEEQVVQGHADMAITSPRPEGLAWHLLTTEQEEVSLTEVADEPFIVLRHRYGLRSIIENLFREAGIRPKIAFEGEEIRTLRGLVAAGLGVAVVPPGDAVAGIAERVFAGARRRIGLVWVADRTRPPAVENFRHFVLAHAAEYGVEEQWDSH
jgi:DNA-binding transcriptional LysR family regulator